MTELVLLCVHPHPDDESIACGGVLARAADEGIRTHVVTCTGGEAGDNLAGIDLGGRALPDVRRAEMDDASRLLGLTSHHWLGYRDSGMAGTAANDHPDAFVRADLYEAAGRLAGIIRELRPQVVVSDDEFGTYGHPDHVRAHQVTERAVTMAADPWWETDQDPWQVTKRYVHSFSRSRMLSLHRLLLDRGLASPFGEGPLEDAEELPFGTADDAITTRVDVRAWLDRKQAAIAAHRSQVASDSFFLNVPREFSALGFGVEEYILLADHLGGAAPGPEEDLFAGLREPAR